METALQPTASTAPGWVLGMAMVLPDGAGDRRTPPCWERKGSECGSVHTLWHTYRTEHLPE